MKTIMEQLSAIRSAFPTEPFKPTAFDTGVAEQLRDIAAQIETGVLSIKHFSLTLNEDGGQKLGLEAE